MGDSNLFDTFLTIQKFVTNSYEKRGASFNDQGKSLECYNLYSG